MRATIRISIVFGLLVGCTLVVAYVTSETPQPSVSSTQAETRTSETLLEQENHEASSISVATREIARSEASTEPNAATESGNAIEYHAQTWSQVVDVGTNLTDLVNGASLRNDDPIIVRCLDPLGIGLSESAIRSTVAAFKERLETLTQVESEIRDAQARLVKSRAEQGLHSALERIQPGDPGFNPSADHSVRSPSAGADELVSLVQVGSELRSVTIRPMSEPELAPLLRSQVQAAEDLINDMRIFVVDHYAQK
ncbi:MAG: hypothetical protein IPH13_02000 [Planctomycetes bacterium]|nr:hypothetical protein [Planctomycetota bacterium]